MDKDEVKGTAKEIKGGLKEVAGRVTGDKSTEVKGNIEKNVGTAQRKVGEVKDDLKKDLDDDTSAP